MTAEPPPYPRIPHLVPTPRAQRDDLVVPAERCGGFLTGQVVVEEKLDGANVVLWVGEAGRIAVAGRGGAGAMDRAAQLGRLRAWASQRADRLLPLLTDGWVLYGEWLWLAHSVRYERLPDLLVGLDLWSPKRGFASADERDRVLASTGIATPPRRFTGVLGSLDRLADLFGPSAFGAPQMEGLILRRERDGAVRDRAKLLAPGFTRVTDPQWKARRQRRNAVTRG
ncbi:MAG: RNA ligase family protein [Egibacteraceae bacterium]